jgi:predicted small secreted protein
MRKTPAKLLIGFLVVGGAVSLLGACNTTAGAGKDVSAVGSAVTNTADKAK